MSILLRFSSNILTADRVKWFRDWADIDRHGEEVETLEAEVDRGVITHGRMESCWREMEGSAVGLGAKAFAATMADTYSRLLDRMEEARVKIRGYVPVEKN